MQKKTYAVLGLGRYGKAVARELVENGLEVIAVDTSLKNVNDAAAYIPVCKCADITDSEVINRLGIGNVDVAIVCITSNLEASVLAITLCKEAGVPTVIAKCANEMHQKILLKVGADYVVFPEQESGVRLAKNLLTSGFIDMIAISEDISVVEIDVKKEWIGKNLIELNLRKKYGINIMAIKKDKKVNMNINPEQVLDSEMTLIVIADVARLRKMN